VLADVAASVILVLEELDQRLRVPAEGIGIETRWRRGRDSRQSRGEIAPSRAAQAPRQTTTLSQSVSAIIRARRHRPTDAVSAPMFRVTVGAPADRVPRRPE